MGQLFSSDWSGHLPWRSKYYLSVTLFTDTSQKAWGAVLLRDGASQQIRHYWLDYEHDINVLEARELYNVLSSFFPSIKNARIDVWTDNVTLQAAWENGTYRNSLVNQEMKRVEEMSRAGNFTLHLKYVPSTKNVADALSCALSDIDCSLSTVVWARVQSRFGPHTFDRMPLDRNCCRGRDGNFLPHYSPWPTPNSSGTNVFAQPIPSGHKIYIFSPLRPCRTAPALFLGSMPQFCFYYHCPSFISMSLLVDNSSSFSD